MVPVRAAVALCGVEISLLRRLGTPPLESALARSRDEGRRKAANRPSGRRREEDLGVTLKAAGGAVPLMEAVPESTAAGGGSQKASSRLPYPTIAVDTADTRTVRRLAHSAARAGLCDSTSVADCRARKVAPRFRPAAPQSPVLRAPSGWSRTRGVAARLHAVIGYSSPSAPEPVRQARAGARCRLVAKWPDCPGAWSRFGQDVDTPPCVPPTGRETSNHLDALHFFDGERVHSPTV